MISKPGYWVTRGGNPNNHRNNYFLLQTRSMLRRTRLLVEFLPRAAAVAARRPPHLFSTRNTMASPLKRSREETWVTDPTAVIKSTDMRGAGRPDPAATTLVIYHGPYCPDGYGAAFAAWKLLGDRARYVPAEHGPAAPRGLDVRGQHVVVLDYCFPAAETARMIAEAASFVCIDHHASAEKELAAVPDAHKVFEMRQSGAT